MQANLVQRRPPRGAGHPLRELESIPHDRETWTRLTDEERRIVLEFIERRRP
jgi:hypothetical protein